MSPGVKMKNLKPTLCAAVLVLAISSMAFAKAGTISTTRAGTISTTRAGTISTTATGTVPNDRSGTIATTRSGLISTTSDRAFVDDEQTWFFNLLFALIGLR